ncbi:MAG: endolytic transglycosylase MltG [Clostridia bacterium]|nr:endolytic transglycosylase MltG [Clostridia bacterium]NLS84399.1 endolytic transglycosylase MltG [Oscillospiraceae bacterium]
MARRRRRNGPNGCLIAILVFLAIILIAAGAAFFLAKGDIDGKRGAEVEKTIIVEMGSSPSTIGKQLQSEGIIKNGILFRFYVKQKDVAETLQYGEFTFNSAMSYDEIITTLQTTNKDRDTVIVTFPEGTTAVQFGARLEEAGLCTSAEFLEVANTGDFSHLKFWSKRDENPSQFMACEGYLFPETYEFFKDATAYDIVNKIYTEFDSKFTDEMYAQVESMGFTLTEFVTLSSIVQEEAGLVDHQSDVAAVFMSRLAENSIVNKLESNCSSYLQKDAENNYIYNTIAPYYGGWDAIPVEVYNNYNTYEKVGLPAGPISNPGLDAMTNTLKYQSSPYWDTANPYYFFLTDKAGKYYFAHTANEHVANDEAAQIVNASLGK